MPDGAVKPVDLSRGLRRFTRVNSFSHHCGELQSRSAQAKAERIITEVLRRRGREEKEPANRRKNDLEKLEVAARFAMRGHAVH